MKRSESLKPLSHDHHQALFVALGLQRADGETAADAAAAFLKFWDEDGRRHFRDEEEILLPAYAEHGDVTDPLVARVLTDHVTIRSLARRLEQRQAGSADSPEPEELQNLGTVLAEHVRREERELFPKIEEALPEGDAAALGEILIAAERERSG